MSDKKQLINTFEFKVGDEFEDNQQILNGLIHFGLVEKVPAPVSKEGGILLPSPPQIKVIRDFTIGWKEDAD